MATTVLDVWVTDVSVTGYKKDTGRRRAWVYVIETCWTNQTRFELYRRYSDFFAFQNTLLSLFPREAGKYDHLDRCIPYLPTADNVLQLLGGNFSAKHLEARLATINHYCETILVKLGPHLSQSHYVLQFFKCQPGDKQLLGPVDRPPSMHPQNIPAGSVFEEYLVTIDFTPTTSEHLSVSVGETVSVISKDSSDWWYVAKGGNLTGWVPKTYLQRTTGNAEDFLDDPEEWAGNETAVKRCSHVAIADYDPTDPNQLAFKEGAEITVLDKEEDGWWLAVVDNRVGWVPSSFLEPLEGEIEDFVKEASKEVEISSGEDTEAGRPSPTRFWVMKKYTAVLPDEVDLSLHAEVEVVDMNLSGWWLVRVGGREGVAPAAYLSPVNPQSAESAVEDGEEGMRERRGSFIKREYMQIRTPPPRSESVRKLSKRYHKNGDITAQKTPILISKKLTCEGDCCEISGNCSVPSHLSSPLLNEDVEDIDADRDAVVPPLSHSPVFGAPLDGFGDSSEPGSSLPRSSPVLSKKPPYTFFNFSPTSSPRSSPILSRQLSGKAPNRDSPTARKKFGETLSVDVADVSCEPKPRGTQSWSREGEDNTEAA